MLMVCSLIGCRLESEKNTTAVLVFFGKISLFFGTQPILSYHALSALSYRKKPVDFAENYDVCFRFLGV